MSTYGDGGTTYGDLFGGGTALYGDFGTGGGVTVVVPPTRHKLIEQSSGILRERSAGRYIEVSEGTVIE